MRFKNSNQRKAVMSKYKNHNIEVVERKEGWIGVNLGRAKSPDDTYFQSYVNDRPFSSGKSAKEALDNSKRYIDSMSRSLASKIAKDKGISESTARRKYVTTVSDMSFLDE